MKQEKSLEKLLSTGNNECRKKRSWKKRIFGFFRKYAICSFAAYTLISPGHTKIVSNKPVSLRMGPNVHYGKILLSSENARIEKFGMNFNSRTDIIWEFYEDTRCPKNSEYAIVLESQGPMGKFRVEFVDFAADGLVNSCSVYLKEWQKRDINGIDRIILQINDSQEILKRGSNSAKIISSALGQDVFGLGLELHMSYAHRINEKVNKRMTAHYAER